MLLKPKARKTATSTQSIWTEEWRDIDLLSEYPIEFNNHEVSNQGVIRNKKTKRPLTPNYVAKNPFVVLTYQHKNIRDYYIVIRLPISYAVLNTFQPNSTINTKNYIPFYKDGNKLNAHITNLFWATEDEVRTIKIKAGHNKRGPKPKMYFSSYVTLMRTLFTLNKDITKIEFTILKLVPMLHTYAATDSNLLREWKLRRLITVLLNKKIFIKEVGAFDNNTILYRFHPRFKDEWEIWEAISSNDVELLSHYGINSDYMDEKPFTSSADSGNSFQNTDEDTPTESDGPQKRTGQARKGMLKSKRTRPESDDADDFGWEEDPDLTRALQSAYEFEEDEDIKAEIRKSVEED
jgi:hypothetical protein